LKGTDAKRQLSKALTCLVLSAGFTSVFPVRVQPYVYGRSLDAAIKAVKEQIRSVPNHGIGYGVLRYLSPHDDVREQLTRIRPSVGFNYLGQFAAGANMLLRPTSEIITHLPRFAT